MRIRVLVLLAAFVLSACSGGGVGSVQTPTAPKLTAQSTLGGALPLGTSISADLQPVDMQGRPLLWVREMGEWLSDDHGILVATSQDAPTSAQVARFRSARKC